MDQLKCFTANNVLLVLLRGVSNGADAASYCT